MRAAGAHEVLGGGGGCGAAGGLMADPVAIACGCCRAETRVGVCPYTGVIYRERWRDTDCITRARGWLTQL